MYRCSLHLHSSIAGREKQLFSEDSFIFVNSIQKKKSVSVYSADGQKKKNYAMLDLSLADDPLPEEAGRGLLVIGISAKVCQGHSCAENEQIRRNMELVRNLFH